MDKDQQILNCLMGFALVEELRRMPRRITRDLSRWANDEMIWHGPNHCGSAACFGGWVARTPAFQKQGVFPGSITGEPLSRVEGHTLLPSEVAEKLFGLRRMFREFSYPEERMFWGSKTPELDAIHDRLTRALENLLKD